MFGAEMQSVLTLHLDQSEEACELESGTLVMHSPFKQPLTETSL